jgi:hypothetical protein
MRRLPGRPGSLKACQAMGGGIAFDRKRITPVAVTCACVGMASDAGHSDTGGGTLKRELGNPSLCTPWRPMRTLENRWRSPMLGICL